MRAEAAPRRARTDAPWWEHPGLAAGRWRLSALDLRALGLRCGHRDCADGVALGYLESLGVTCRALTLRDGRGGLVVVLVRGSA
jgi:hypothetical protein